MLIERAYLFPSQKTVIDIKDDFDHPNHLLTIGIASSADAEKVISTLKAQGVNKIDISPDLNFESKTTVVEPHCRDSDEDKLLGIITASCLKAVTLARELKIPVTFSLVDQAGHELFSYRMPHALLVSIELARKKARTAVYMNSATSALHSLSQPEGILYNIEAISQGQVVTFGGGLPLVYDGKVFAAVGVSGASNPEDDERIANCWIHYLTSLHLYQYLHISNLKGVSYNENI